LHEYNFSVICYPSGLTIPPNLLCYRCFEVYLYVLSFAASHFRQVSADSGLSQLQNLGNILIKETYRFGLLRKNKENTGVLRGTVCAKKDSHLLNGQRFNKVESI